MNSFAFVLGAAAATSVQIFDDEVGNLQAGWQVDDDNWIVLGYVFTPVEDLRSKAAIFDNFIEIETRLYIWDQTPEKSIQDLNQ